MVPELSELGHVVGMVMPLIKRRADAAILQAPKQQWSSWEWGKLHLLIDCLAFSWMMYSHKKKKKKVLQWELFAPTVPYQYVLSIAWGKLCTLTTWSLFICGYYPEPNVKVLIMCIMWSDTCQTNIYIYILFIYKIHMILTDHNYKFIHVYLFNAWFYCIYHIPYNTG